MRERRVVEGSIQIVAQGSTTVADTKYAVLECNDLLHQRRRTGGAVGGGPRRLGGDGTPAADTKCGKLEYIH